MSVFLLLSQTDVWTDREGRTVPLDSIDARYAANIVRLLERCARCYASMALNETLSCPSPTADMAADAWEDEVAMLSHASFDRGAAVDWLHEEPLVRALLEKAGE